MKSSGPGSKAGAEMQWDWKEGRCRHGVVTTYRSATKAGDGGSGASNSIAWLLSRGGLNQALGTRTKWSTNVRLMTSPVCCNRA